MNFRYELLEREITRKINGLETLEDLYREVLEQHEPLRCNIYNARVELIVALQYLEAWRDAETDRKGETNT